MKNLLSSPYRKLAAVALFLYAAMQVHCLRQLSVNYDEASFAGYGVTLLKLQRNKDVVLYESKLPITTLNAVPRVAEQLLHPGLKKSWPESQSDVVNGRYVSLLFGILLGLLIFRWSAQLYSEKIAFFILVPYLLCPNFLAHSVFVSSDIFACFFMTAALYFLWRFFREQKFRYFLLMCLATAFAEISKFSMVHLFLLLPLLFTIQVLYQKRPATAYRLSFVNAVGYAALFLFVNWLVISASHLFFQLFLPLNDYEFRSNGFKTLQAFFNKTWPGFPVPLPSSYLRSMDAVMYFDALGGGVKGSLNGAPYILGQNSVYGFWYYYFVALFFKVPVALLLLWGASFALLSSRFKRVVFFQREIFLVLPALYFLFYMSFFYSTQVGIRHLLIVFPLLFIFSGKIISPLLAGRKRFLLYSLLAYQAVSVLWYFPHFLPYTNEFILDKKMAYKKLADTNICYGEGGKFLGAYLAEHPDCIYMPDKPTAGKVVLEINEMLNLNIATVHKYDWAALLQPVDHVHSQYLVFDVSEQTADSLKRLFYRR